MISNAMIRFIIPMPNPDFITTYGIPRMPAPTTVPIKTEIAANVLLIFLFLRGMNSIRLKKVFISYFRAHSLMDRMTGFGPVDRGSIPRGPM